MKHQYYYVSLVKNRNNKYFTLNLPKSIYQNPSSTFSLKLINCSIDGESDPPKEQGIVQIAVSCQEIEPNFCISVENKSLGGEHGVLGVIEANIFKKGRTRTENNSVYNLGYCELKHFGCLNTLNFNLIMLSYPSSSKFQELNKISHFVICFEIVQKSNPT